MSLELVVPVAVVFGPMVLILALIARTAGPVARDHRAPRPSAPSEAGLRWPTEVAGIPRVPSGEPAAERPLPALYERDLRHG